MQCHGTECSKERIHSRVYGRSNGISIVAQSESAHVSNDADLNKQCGFQQQDIVTMIEEKDHGETGPKFGVLEWS